MWHEKTLLIGDEMKLKEFGCFDESNVIYVEYAQEGEAWPSDTAEVSHLGSLKSGST